MYYRCRVEWELDFDYIPATNKFEAESKIKDFFFKVTRSGYVDGVDFPDMWTVRHKDLKVVCWKE